MILSTFPPYIAGDNTLPIVTILIIMFALHLFIYNDQRDFELFPHALIQFIFILGIAAGYNSAVFDSSLVPNSLFTFEPSDLIGIINLMLVMGVSLTTLFIIAKYGPKYFHVHIGKRETTSDDDLSRTVSSSSTSSDEDQSQNQDPPPTGQITESDSMDKGPGPHTTNVSEETEN